MSKNSEVLDITDKDDLTLTIGKNLRRLRTQRGLSLERLAGISGVSRAMLSHIELGQSAPTITVLDKITRALTVSLSLLINQNERKNAFLLKAQDVKAQNSPDGKARFRALFPYDVHNSGRVEFYQLSLAGSGKHQADPRPVGATDNVVVQQGLLEVKLGKEIYKLQPGDALYFASDLPHTYINPGDSEAIAYLVTSYGHLTN